HWRGYAKARGLPLLEDLERGLKSVRHLIDYALFRRNPRPIGSERKPISFVLPVASTEQTLTEAQSKKILAAARRPATHQALARHPADAVELAAGIGGAVALKIQSPDIPHKSDIGGVHLGARDAEEVEAAARRVLDNAHRNCPAARIDGVLVQEMV